jgi:hypothetical protein
MEYTIVAHARESSNDNICKQKPGIHQSVEVCSRFLLRTPNRSIAAGINPFPDIATAIVVKIVNCSTRLRMH